MSEQYKIIDSETPTFITLTVVGWVDLFIRRIYTDILDDSLKYCVKEKGIIIHAYVYMTSHIHLIVSSEKTNLNDFVRDFKKHTTRELLKEIDTNQESRKVWMLAKFNHEAHRLGRAKNYKLWKDGFHPVILDTNKKRDPRVHYIHYNPIDAGFVVEESAWVNSSYLAYEESKLHSNIPVNPLW